MDSEQISALYQLGGALSVVVVGAFFGIRWVITRVGALPSATVETKKTTIITGDTVAMGSLAKSLEAVNVTLTETNLLIKGQIKEREIDEEVERRMREREARS